MSANIQHADALKVVQHLEAKVLVDPSYLMTYSDVAAVLERDPAKDGRHIGQVMSRIDAACFYAKTPFLAMHRVRETEGGKINLRSFQGDLWRPHAPELIARAERHVWTVEDFNNIKRALNSLGDDAATLLWRRIEGHGERAVHKALGLPQTSVDR